MYVCIPLSLNICLMPGLFNYAVVEWPHFAAHVAARAHGLHEGVVVFDGNRAMTASSALPEWLPDMPIGRARRLYPYATFVCRDRAREDTGHAALERRLVQFSPRIQARSLGCFLLQNPDVDGIADFITRHSVLRGAAAPYSEWAHLAVCTTQPGTVRLVYDGTAFLADTKTSVLATPGGPLGAHGPDVAHRLGLFGLHHLGVVAERLSRRHLRVQFGPTLGSQIDRLLRPGRRQPSVPLYQRPRGLNTTCELEQPSPLGAPWIEAETLRLATRLAEELRGLAALTLSLQAFVPGRGMVRECYLAHRGISSETDLRRLTKSLYQRLYNRLVVSHAEVLSFQLSAGKLTARARVQGNLFSPRTEHPALKRAVRLLQQRYGEQAVLRAQPADSLFVETRYSLTPLRWET